MGKIYLKLDGSHGEIKFGRRKIISLFLKMCCCVSTELPERVNAISQEWKRKIIYVPNPFNPNEIREYKPFSERQNVIITMGRLGTRQKAMEILLEAFAKISPQVPDWKLKLAGRIEGNMNIASDFYAKYPELSERVIFTSEVRDRNELIQLYRDSKIFAFPSRHEGCPLALSEALSHGLFAVTSDIFPNRSITENFRFALGSKVNDVDGMAKNLLYACTHESEIEKLAIEGREAALKRCDLENICRLITEGLK